MFDVGPGPLERSERLMLSLAPRGVRMFDVKRGLARGQKV